SSRETGSLKTRTLPARGNYHLANQAAQRRRGANPLRFMSQSNQEQAARRFHTDNYDCQPTPDVLEELIAPKRPRILSRPRPSAKGPLGWLYLVLAAVFIVVVALSTTWRPQRATERARDRNAIIQPVAPQPTPASTPVPLPPGSAARWKAY